MKVYIVNPPVSNNHKFIREGRCMQVTASWGSLWMPLTLAYIASVLRQDDHKIRLKDCLAENINTKNLMKMINEFNPELIVLNTSFPSIKSDMKIASVVRDLYPQIKISIIGMYPTLLKSKAMEEYRDLDFAIAGEPEWVIKNLANSLENKKSLQNVKGLVFRENGQIITNPNQNLSENNLNDLPFPARDLLNNDAYRHVSDNGKFTLLNTARGCPYGCIFCNAHNYYGTRCRKRKVESIITEIRECVHRYQIRKFLFWDEGYTLDNTYGEEIADAIIESGLKITWYTRARIDNLQLSILKKMKQSGCTGISLGIESTNQKILDMSEKDIDIKYLDDAIRMIKSAGIATVGHFVFGLPGDTMESANETIKFAVNSGLDFAQFYCAVPYPNTKLGELAIKNGWIETFDYSKYHLAESVMHNECLTVNDIKKLRQGAFKAFYRRKKLYIRLSDMIKNDLSFSNILRIFLDVLGFRGWAK